MLLPAGLPRMLTKRPQGLLIFSSYFELQFLKNFEDAAASSAKHHLLKLFVRPRLARF
jgi:hypothetical protein